jgi:hypothetical protein
MWQELLCQQSSTTQPADWLGIFAPEEQELLQFIVCASNDFQPPIVQDPVGIRLPPNHPCFTVGSKSRSLISLPRHQAEPRIVEGLIRCIRIIHIKKGDNDSLRIFHKYLGKISELAFDLGQWTWRAGGHLHTYTSKKGQHLR